MAKKSPTVRTGAAKSGDEMTRDEIVAFFNRRQDAHNNLDAARLAADYAPDAVIESPVAGAHAGRNAEAAFQAVFDAFIDMKVRTESLIIDGQRVALVLSMSGTQIGRFLGLSATGKPFHVTMVFVYELKGRQIVRERRIYDFTGLLVQIGVLKAKPA